MGTTKQSRPGFTIDKNRLNVMLTRQRSGLVIVGDIFIVDITLKAPGQKKVSIGANAAGQKAWFRTDMLQNVLRDLYTRQRYIIVR